jgi:hypothetical protein
MTPNFGMRLTMVVAAHELLCSKINGWSSVGAGAPNCGATRTGDPLQELRHRFCGHQIPPRKNPT